MRNIFYEFTIPDLVQNHNRFNDFSPKKISYQGFSFRSKIAFFNVGKYEQKLRIKDHKIVSKLKGDDPDKIHLALGGDIDIYCSCPDFLFGGWKYIAHQLDYGTDKETRPPDIRNPQREGTICKHLVYLLENVEDFIDEISLDIEIARKTQYRTVRKKFTKDKDKRKSNPYGRNKDLEDESELLSDEEQNEE